MVSRQVLHLERERVRCGTDQTRIEGGVFFPGRAFDDAEGNPMDPVGLLRLRLGIRY